MRAHRIVSLVFLGLAVASAGLSIHLGAPVATGSGQPSARRIVAGSVALGEILYAIKAGDRVVGRSHFATWPPECLALPDIGGAIDPNLEVLETLKPDCLLLQMKSDRVDSFAADRGIRVERFKIETIADLFAATVRLGALTGHDLDAQAEVARLSSAIDAQRQRAPAKRPRVLISSERTPGQLRDVGTLGAGTFIMECIEVAGGDNALPAVRGYAPVSMEAVLEAKPDVVIELRAYPEKPELHEALVRDWRAGFPELPVVKEGRVRVVYHPAVLVPGPRLDQVIALFAEALAR